MMVARHEMPGKQAETVRPVLSAIARMATEEGNGVIRSARPLQYSLQKNSRTRTRTKRFGRVFTP
jgi:hypothetical protein